MRDGGLKRDLEDCAEGVCGLSKPESLDALRRWALRDAPPSRGHALAVEAAIVLLLSARRFRTPDQTVAAVSWLAARKLLKRPLELVSRLAQLDPAQLARLSQRPRQKMNANTGRLKELPYWSLCKGYIYIYLRPLFRDCLSQCGPPLFEKRSDEMSVGSGSLSRYRVYCGACRQRVMLPRTFANIIKISQESAYSCLVCEERENSPQLSLF